MACSTFTETPKAGGLYPETATRERIGRGRDRCLPYKPATKTILACNSVAGAEGMAAQDAELELIDSHPGRR